MEGSHKLVGDQVLQCKAPAIHFFSSSLRVPRAADVLRDVSVGIPHSLLGGTRHAQYGQADSLAQQVLAMAKQNQERERDMSRCMRRRRRRRLVVEE